MKEARVILTLQYFYSQDQVQSSNINWDQNPETIVNSLQCVCDGGGGVL